MSYFNTQFSGGSVPQVNAMQARSFIERMKDQDKQRRERSKALAEDQKRLELLAQGYGMEKGEASSMSRGELSGFIEKKTMEVAQRKAEQDQILNLQKFANQVQQTDINRQMATSQMKFADANLKNAENQQTMLENEKKRIIQDAQAIRAGMESGGMSDFSKFLPKATANQMSDEGLINAFQKFGGRNRNPFANMSPMQQAMDTKAGQNFATYNPNIAKSNISKLERAIGQIENAIATGENIAGTAKSFLPEIMQNALNKGGVALKEAVESVIQLNLRETLGAQFTEKEGMLFMKRGYNPTGTDQENLIKVRDLLQKVKASADLEAKRYQYGTTHGTMQGFVPPMPSGITSGADTNATQPTTTSSGNPFSSTPLGKIVK